MPLSLDVLSKSNLGTVRKFVAKYEPYSDFNPTSLYCWAGEDNVQFTVADDVLVICMQDYVSRRPVYTLIGETGIDSSIRKLLTITPRLTLVPATVAASIKEPGRFHITEDRDNFDYIYRVSDLAELPGSTYKKKRNKLSRLLHDVGDDLRVHVTRGISSSDKDRALEVFDRWADDKSSTRQESSVERSALTRLWDNDNQDIVIVWIIYKEQVVGFSVNELLQGGYAICHFEKAASIHENVNTYITNKVAGALRLHGVQYMNWEQDLGIEGLRKSKESYHPSMHLKKYTITNAESIVPRQSA